MLRKLFKLGLWVVMLISAALLLDMHGHGNAKKARLTAAISDLRGIYLYWKQDSRPMGTALEVSYGEYRPSWDQRPVTPTIFTDVLFTEGTNSQCLFRWIDKKRVPKGALVVTTDGRCFFLSDSGQAQLLGEFENPIGGMLNRDVGHYYLISQPGASNGTSQLAHTNKTATADGVRR